MKVNETRKTLYEQVNQGEEIFDLFEIPKDLYTLHILRQDECGRSTSDGSLINYISEICLQLSII